MPLNVANAGEWFRQGRMLHSSGRLYEAEAQFNNVLKVDPEHTAALLHLGIIASQTARNDLAVNILLRAIEKNPHIAEVHNSLGEAYRALGRQEEALAAYDRAIELDPKLIVAYNNRGLAYSAVGRISHAMDQWHAAIAIAEDAAASPGPQTPDRRQSRLDPRMWGVLPLNNLANACLEQGDLASAIAYHTRALEINPADPVVHSNLLRDHLHVTDLSEEEKLAACRNWWSIHTSAITPLPLNHRGEPNKSLRIGFVSPDFRQHPTAYFLKNIFEHRDRNGFSFVCFASVLRPDDVTHWFKSSCDAWHNILPAPDDVVARIIHEQKIDILVDLTGHAARTRLRVFAYRPAPVQIAYMGYPGSTGSPVIDWRITDMFADPPGMTEAHFSEKLWRLPRTAWCYSPLFDAEAEALPPVVRNPKNSFTFGCFNNNSKVTDHGIRTWAAILQQVPNSRLFLKAKTLRNDAARARLLARFASHGIRAERLRLSGWETSMVDHMRRYNEIDLALDTFPYHGTTTTCDSLWMNVPVLTLAGKSHISRVGVSLLNSAGLRDLIAHSDTEYVATAVKFASDPERLLAVRAGLRERFQSSPVCDGPSFARDFCTALRGIWRDACGRFSTEVPERA